MTESVNETQEQPVGEPVQLSLQDIASVVNVIDTVSERGAFKGIELETIGALRNRIATFLNSVAPADQEETEEPSAEG